MFQDTNETSICVVLDPDEKELKVLPLKLYDCSTQIVEGKISYNWNELKYKIGADESERLAIDEAKSTSATGDRSEYAATLNSHLNAVKMLRERLEFLQS